MIVQGTRAQTVAAAIKVLFGMVSDHAPHVDREHTRLANISEQEEAEFAEWRMPVGKGRAAEDDLGRVASYAG